MSDYRLNIVSGIDSLLGVASGGRALDFGCGDGWFALEFLRRGIFSKVVGVDVKERNNCVIEPVMYDGVRLPFVDGEFDVVYAIDVLHHCHDPQAALWDMARCSKRFLLVKDHTCNGPLGALTLQLLDWVGNIKFGIPSPGNYQRHFDWDAALLPLGWRLVTRIHPLPCHVGFLGRLTNGLQYASLYERC